MFVFGGTSIFLCLPTRDFSAVYGCVRKMHAQLVETTRSVRNVEDGRKRAAGQGHSHSIEGRSH